MGALSMSDVVYWLVAGMISVFFLWLVAGGTTIRWNQLAKTEWVFLFVLTILALLAGWAGWLLILLIWSVSQRALGLHRSDHLTRHRMDDDS